MIFYFGALAYFFISGFEYPYFFIGLTLITLISFLDDVFTLSNKIRLTVHLLSMILMFFQLGLFELNILIVILAFVLTIGITNAYNFMDGINGITGIYSLSVLLGLWLINTFHIHFIDNSFIYCAALSLLVFNFYNFRKRAKCFAGDVGAMAMVFIILFMIGKLLVLEPNIAIVLLLAVYGVDSVLTIIHRLILKENIFVAHRKHLYQILANEAKIPHLVVSTIYAVIQILINLLLLYILQSDYGILNTLLILIAILSFMSIVYVVVKKRHFHLHKIG